MPLAEEYCTTSLFSLHQQPPTSWSSQLKPIKRDIEGLISQLQASAIEDRHVSRLVDSCSAHNCCRELTEEEKDVTLRDLERATQKLTTS
jgi:uncharacterized alpha-E superfamily protein